MDSKYNTNFYKLPFLTICTLSNQGHIEILIKSFIKDEKKDTFIWVLRFFLKIFGDVITATMDGCKELIRATEEVYPNILVI